MRHVSGLEGFNSRENILSLYSGDHEIGEQKKFRWKFFSPSKFFLVIMPTYFSGHQKWKNPIQLDRITSDTWRFRWNYTSSCWPNRFFWESKFSAYHVIQGLSDLPSWTKRSSNLWTHNFYFYLDFNEHFSFLNTRSGHFLCIQKIRACHK